VQPRSGSARHVRADKIKIWGHGIYLGQVASQRKILLVQIEKFSLLRQISARVGSCCRWPMLMLLPQGHRHESRSDHLSECYWPKDKKKGGGGNGSRKTKERIAGRTKTTAIKCNVSITAIYVRTPTLTDSEHSISEQGTSDFKGFQKVSEYHTSLYWR